MLPRRGHCSAFSFPQCLSSLPLLRRREASYANHRYQLPPLPDTNSNNRGIMSTSTRFFSMDASSSDDTGSSGSAGGGRRFGGLQSIGTGTPNIPTATLGGAPRKRSFAVKEWSEGQLSDVQDALRELREYDLDDPYRSVMSKEDEAFLESAELHASMKSSHDQLLSNLAADDPNNDGSSLGGVALTREQKEALHKRLMGYRTKLRSNPYGHVKIYRNEGPGFESIPTQLSVDVNPRKLREMLNDYDGKRCILCSETYQTWHIHQGFIPHAAREAIVFELLRPFCGTPDDIIKMWWWRLHYSKRFRRIRELSHHDSRQRKKRLLYILKFLRDRQVIRESFNVNHFGGGVVSSGRSWEFERLEFFGDNVVKYLFNDRFNVLFPVHEGGVKGKAPYCQFMIDGNDGLARAYDYLEFHKLTESDRVISKFKSDVMETVFGELQLYLWSTEIDDGAEQHQLPFTPEFIPLRAIVWHAMEELGHVMLMYHLEYVLGIVKKVVKDNNLNFIRSDPALRTNLEMQRELASSVYSQRKMASQKRFITAEKVSFPFHDTALVTGQYYTTIQKQIQQVGGLLPRPFARKDLGASHLFMDHLTVVTPQPIGGVARAAINDRHRILTRQKAEADAKEVAVLAGAITSSASSADKNSKGDLFTTLSLKNLSEGEVAAIRDLLPLIEEDTNVETSQTSPLHSAQQHRSVSKRAYRLLQKSFGSAALQASKLNDLAARLSEESHLAKALEADPLLAKAFNKAVSIGNGTADDDDPTQAVGGDVDPHAVNVLSPSLSSSPQPAEGAFDADLDKIDLALDGLFVEKAE